MTHTFFNKVVLYRAITVVFVLSAALVAGGTLWAYFGLAHIGGGAYILHADDLRGITLIDSNILIALAGILGLLFVFLDYVVALECEARGLIWGKILMGMAFFFAVLLFIAFAGILSIN